MTNHPPEVLAAVTQAEEKHPQDVEAAVRMAAAAVRRLPDYERYVAGLVEMALRELIYDRRHQANVKMRKEAGFYGQPAKVRVDLSPGVQRAYQSLYAYRIAGKMLGMVTGEELLPLAEQEEAIAEGHRGNAALLRQLRPLVPDGKKVQDTVTAKKLKSLFRQVQLDKEDETKGVA